MNLYTSPKMSTFPFITCTIPSVLSKSCHEFYQPTEMKQPTFTTTIKYNMHRRQQKSLNVYVNALSAEHNRWLCTIPLWQGTQMVSHPVRHT